MGAETAKVVDLPAAAVYQQEFTIRYDYPVYFTERVFDRDNPVFAHALSPARSRQAASLRRLRRRQRRGELAGAGARGRGLCAGACGRTMELVAPPEVVPAGEQVKNDPTLVTRLQQRLGELAIDRHSYVVGVGGGALLDMIGYVAATTHRGVRHIRVPTTVLAQNDSGVGVKNGINAFGKKNFLGCFAPPHAVLNDFDFLRTLHPRDRISGIAEAVKVSLIRDATVLRVAGGECRRIARLRSQPPPRA